MLSNLSASEVLAHYGLPEAHPKSFSSATLSSHILYRPLETVEVMPLRRKAGLLLTLLALGGLVSATFPFVRLEAAYAVLEARDSLVERLNPWKKTQVAIEEAQKPEINPLVDPDGNPIEPVSRDFSIIIPKIGVNAPVIAGVNPVNDKGYNSALEKGVAHAATSFYPDENGTVYLFSHSTNYEWFVRDLNAVFYLIKNLKPGDLVVVMYMGNRYTYEIREQKIVANHEVGYLIPQPGARTLILQSCWPPGTFYKRMLIFADLVDEKVYGTFGEEILN